MIIDCHGHYTLAPEPHQVCRKELLTALTQESRHKVFEANARRVLPRLDGALLRRAK
jgi:hypothetical protein